MEIWRRKVIFRQAMYEHVDSLKLNATTGSTHEVVPTMEATEAADHVVTFPGNDRCGVFATSHVDDENAFVLAWSICSFVELQQTFFRW